MCKPAIALNVIAGAKTINTDDNTAINAFEKNREIKILRLVIGLARMNSISPMLLGLEKLM
jgi:hypothetical protein